MSSASSHPTDADIAVVSIYAKRFHRISTGLLGVGLAMIGLAVAVHAWGLINGFAGIGLGKVGLVSGGVLAVLTGLALRLGPVQVGVVAHLQALLVAAVWAAILGLGLVGAELYVRASEGYVVFSWPLHKHAYSELDRLKVYNQRFIEEHDTEFDNWPIPLETFAAETSRPRYLFKPNLRVANRQGKLVLAEPEEKVFWSSNSWGFRGPEFSLVKPAGTLRIVCLGASTTEGSQDDLVTYPYFLREEMTQRFPDRVIEVINAGHHGQTIDDLVEILRQRVLPLKPDIIIFYEAANNVHFGQHEYLVFNDSGPTGGVTSWSYWFRQWYNHSAIFALLSDRLGWKHPPLPHEFDDASKKRAAVHYRDVLTTLARETLAAGSTIVLSSFITLAHEGLEVPFQENPRLYRDLYVTHWPHTPGEIGRIYDHFNRQSREVAQELGVPYADVAAEFPKDVKYFPFDIIHLSPEANRLLASLFAKHLEHVVLSKVFAGGNQPVSTAAP